MNRTVAGQLAESYCREYPTASTRSLATMLVRDHPKVFPTYEVARSRVRYYRGENGKLSRRSVKSIVGSEKRYDLPPSDAKPVEPVVFTGRGRGIVCSDLHIPYHDLRAVELMLEHAEKEGATDFIVIDGDLLDFYNLSRWEKDPRQRCFAGELEAGRKMLDVFCGVFGEVWYKLGNHEVRYEHYLWRKAPELLGVPDFELFNLMKAKDGEDTPNLKAKGVRVIPDNRVVHAGKLNILHGHEYGRSVFNPVNPARGMFLRAKSHTLTGHNHQTSHHTESDIRGRPTACWSMGCMCDLHPRYAPLNKWDTSFAVMSFDGQRFDVDLKRIIEREVM